MVEVSFPIDELLPHARPMILIDRVAHVADGLIETELTIRKNMPFYEVGKGVAAHIAIEWMAQTCGAYVGLEAVRAGQPARIGFLLGTRNFTANRRWFVEGEKLTVRGRVTFRDEDTAVFDCGVWCQEVEVARSALTLHQPKDVHAVLASQGIELRP